MFRRLNTIIPGEFVREVDIEEASRQLAAGTQLVDVREPGEWAETHIPESMHIPLGNLAARAGELDTSKPVVALCRSGNRSKNAAKIWQNSGFSDATSLAGGVAGLRPAGNPLQK